MASVDWSENTRSSGAVTGLDDLLKQLTELEEVVKVLFDKGSPILKDSSNRAVSASSDVVGSFEGPSDISRVISTCQDKTRDIRASIQDFTERCDL